MGGLTVDYTDEFTNNLLTLGPGEQRLTRYLHVKILVIILHFKFFINLKTMPIRHIDCRELRRNILGRVIIGLVLSRLV